jgi:hypothetical protein
MNLMVNQFLDEFSLTEKSSGSTVNIVDLEEFGPSEETTMLLWDPDLSIPSKDIFEIQEPPAEVLSVQTRSRGHLVSNDLNIGKTLRGKKISDHPKAPFPPQRVPINIHTWESPKLDYNIVEDLKRLKANVSVMDMCRIPQQKDFHKRW